MENANSIKQEPLSSTTAAEPCREYSGVIEQDKEQTAPDDTLAQKVPKRRTKTGCLSTIDS